MEKGAPVFGNGESGCGRHDKCEGGGGGEMEESIKAVRHGKEFGNRRGNTETRGTGQWVNQRKKKKWKKRVKRGQFRKSRERNLWARKLWPARSLWGSTVKRREKFFRTVPPDFRSGRKKSACSIINTMLKVWDLRVIKRGRKKIFRRAAKPAQIV